MKLIIFVFLNLWKPQFKNDYKNKLFFPSNEQTEQDLKVLRAMLSKIQLF
jgi:hypothetical protein